MIIGNKKLDNQLNLLLFPFQTTIIAWIIIGVIVGIMLAGSIGPAPILIYPIAISMLFIPLRRWLAWPERMKKAYGDEFAQRRLLEDGTIADLKSSLSTCASAIGFEAPIHIVISNEKRALHTVSGFKRHYLFIGEAIAHKLMKDYKLTRNREAAAAALMHEIAHFLHRDTQRTQFTKELLRACFIVLGWWLLFLFAFTTLALLSGQALLDFDISQVPDVDPFLVQLLEPSFTISPEFQEEIRLDTETISIEGLRAFIVLSFVTIMAMGALLWAYYWRRMVRFQEHLADYRVSGIIGDSALNRAWKRYPSWTLARSEPNRLMNFFKVVWETSVGAIYRVNNFIGSFIPPYQAYLDWWRRAFDIHPTLVERQTFIKNPVKIYGEWGREATSIVIIMLALEIMQVTPLLSFYLSRYVIHFGALLMFVILGNWALPLIATDLMPNAEVRTNLRKIVLTVFFWRLVWATLNIGLLLSISLFNPMFAQEVMTGIITSSSRYAGFLETSPVSDPVGMTLSIIPGYYALQFVFFAGVSAMLSLFYFWSQRVGASLHSFNWTRWYWQAVFLISVATTCLWLTPFSNVVQGYFDRLTTVPAMIGYLIGILCAAVITRDIRRGK